MSTVDLMDDLTREDRMKLHSVFSLLVLGTREFSICAPQLSSFAHECQAFFVYPCCKI